jgi:hypothetical protein
MVQGRQTTGTGKYDRDETLRTAFGSLVRCVVLCCVIVSIKPESAAVMPLHMHRTINSCRVARKTRERES